MAYIITIQEIKEVTTKENSEWQHIGKEYISYDQYSALSMADQREWKKVDGQYEKNIWGNPPAQEKTKQQKNDIYSQQVESLDLARVISAINNL